MVRERIGRTKPSRAPSVTMKKSRRNDGRPPDTVKELLQKSPSKKKQNQLAKLNERLAIPASVKGAPPVPQSDRLICYPWENNSCWLDVSLQLLFVALSRNFPEFSSLVQTTLDPGYPLRTLHDMFAQRLTLGQENHPDSAVSQLLKTQRNELRREIIEHRLAEHSSSFEPLMVLYISE